MRRINICVILFLLIGSLFACVSVDTCEDYHKDSILENDITKQMREVVQAMDSGDAKKLEEIFFEEAIESKDLNACDQQELDRFLADYSGSKRVLVDCASYLGGSEQINGIKYDTYTGVSAIIITKDNAYALTLSFVAENKKSKGGVVKIWVESAKSEAYENLDYRNRNFSSDQNCFTYCDSYDDEFDNLGEYNGSYVVILGNIMAYKDNTETVTVSEVEAFLEAATTKEDVIAEYGTPAAIWDGVRNSYYYKLADSNHFMRFDLNEDGTVRGTEVSDALYPGWVELE